MHKILVIRLYFSITSSTFFGSNRKIKSNHKNFVHLVGSLTYCRMMHGAYNVKYKRNLCVEEYIILKWIIKQRNGEGSLDLSDII